MQEGFNKTIYFVLNHTYYTLITRFIHRFIPRFINYNKFNLTNRFFASHIYGFEICLFAMLIILSNKIYKDYGTFLYYVYQNNIICQLSEYVEKSKTTMLDIGYKKQAVKPLVQTACCIHRIILVLL